MNAKTFIFMRFINFFAARFCVVFAPKNLQFMARWQSALKSQNVVADDRFPLQRRQPFNASTPRTKILFAFAENALFY
jgi:hypothetical protein